MVLHSCPVCGTNLADIGPPAKQEAHVRACLEGGTGTSPQTAKYLVYKLPEESALIGTECELEPPVSSTPADCTIIGVICLEEFVKGGVPSALEIYCTHMTSRIYGRQVKLLMQLPQR